MLQELITNFSAWYSSNIRLEEAGQCEHGLIYEIFVPAYNKNGEQVSFYISEQRNKFIVSDNCFTMQNMQSLGFNFGPAKIETIENITSNYGIGFDKEDSEIYIEVDSNSQIEFNKKFLNLVYSVLEIDSMSLTMNPTNLWKLFYEEISNNFLQNKIHFRKNPKVPGRYKNNHNFQFQIGGINNLKPVYIKVFNEIDEDKIIISRYDIDKNIPIHILYINSNEKDLRLIKNLESENVLFLPRSEISKPDIFKNYYREYYDTEHVK